MIFISNHGDAPKDWRSIRKAYQLGIDNVRTFHGRTFKRSIHVTDTGGENWGTLPLSLYSHSHVDLETEAVWAPTTANHSGQPSDSCGGTFKRWIRTESEAGNLQGVYDAADIVSYAKTQPEFKEVSQKKYLNATTTRRVFFNLTKLEVESPDDKLVIKERQVETLPGVSLYKQAFSTGEPFKLMVRKRVCCCLPCMEGSYSDCELEVCLLFITKPARVSHCKF